MLLALHRVRITLPVEQAEVAVASFWGFTDLRSDGMDGVHRTPSNSIL